MEALVQWVAPPGVWSQAVNSSETAVKGLFRQPSILRFATDTFMDEFMDVLNNQPERLIDWCVKPETWHGPSTPPAPVATLPPFIRRVQRLRLAAGGATSLTKTALSNTTTITAPSKLTISPNPLKLYQPMHQRFYLMSACLVCRIPGLPDRILNVGAGEKVSFVVRRLRPKNPADVKARSKDFKFNLTTCDEYAFVGARWQKVESDAVEPGEEQLPMFPYTYIERDGRKRRMLSAMVPVGNREKYSGASLVSLEPSGVKILPTSIDPRKVVLMRQVTDPWRSLITSWNKGKSIADAVVPDDEKQPAPADRVKVQNETDAQADYLSWLILIDFSDFLEKYLGKVWDAINGGSAAGLSTAETTLLNTLQNTTMSTGGTRSLAKSLVDIRRFRDPIEHQTDPYPYIPKIPASPTIPTWPNFYFPLQDPNLAKLVNPPKNSGTTTLDDMVNNALQSTVAPADTPPLPLAAQTSMNDVREPLWFVIRCVFDRPNCGPLKPTVMSEATQPFQIAAFFDPDAPARPIRIPLPFDTTPAGLRKFDKNTAFMLSDALCAQMKRAQGMSFGDLVLSVLPWPFHKDLKAPETGACVDDGVSFGMVCSLSIPIITICAFILLIIIVSLLDLIFHWVPFFISCFPIPNFSAKEAT